MYHVFIICFFTNTTHDSTRFVLLLFLSELRLRCHHAQNLARRRKTAFNYDFLILLLPQFRQLRHLVEDLRTTETNRRLRVDLREVDRQHQLSLERCLCVTAPYLPHLQLIRTNPSEVRRVQRFTRSDSLARVYESPSAPSPTELQHSRKQLHRHGIGVREQLAEATSLHRRNLPQEGLHVLVLQLLDLLAASHVPRRPTASASR